MLTYSGGSIAFSDLALTDGVKVLLFGIQSESLWEILAKFQARAALSRNIPSSCWCSPGKDLL